MSLTAQKSDNRSSQIATSAVEKIISLSPSRQKTLSNAFGFYKYAFLVFMVCVCSSVQLAAAEPSIAPINPQFAEQQIKTRPALGAGLQGYQDHSLGYSPSPVNRSHLLAHSRRPLLTESLESLPSSYDLRALGYVTPVKNQGGCGCCWSFATYGPLESWLLKNASETWDFSENHLKNYHGFDLTPCEGGNADMSTAYLARWSGPVSEADDPYHDWDDRPSPGGICQKYVEKVLWFFTSNNIKNAITTYGGMYVTMRMDSAYYNSSQYTYYYSGADANTNHAVTLVGWDDNKVVSGAPGNGAWLIKNSWGTGWGDNGYFWISYYDTAAVKYAVAFCYAASTSLYNTNYQHDPLGFTAAVGDGSSSTTWAANIFTATANEQLKAVGLYAVDDAVSYTIYVYDSFNGSTFSNLLGSVSGTLTNSGYYTIPLASPIYLTAGNDFSIVVQFTTTGYGYPIPMEMDFAGYSSGATASPGQSYISDNGSTFTDITIYSGFENTNVCIRALTALPGVSTLTISSSIRGSTTPATGSYQYTNGTVVNINATPDLCYHFDKWTGSAVAAGRVANRNLANTTVLMDSNYTVEANFAINRTVPAFLGAEGSGRFAAGGSGGDVYEVTNLSNSGPGSIVDAVSQGDRTIVFRVSGTIELGDVLLKPQSNTTIAGQTAPGDGICIKGRIHIKSFVHDIIIRYIRVRVDAGGANSSGDAIDIDAGNNIIIDHVTASYSRDEGISCQEDTDNVTVQWCIISEALTFENHGYGSLIRGEYGQKKTYHHNLYAHNTGRNPRPGNYTNVSLDPQGLYFDFRNNVVYNWKGNYAGYNDDTSMVSRYNLIGNVFIRGSESTTSYGNKGFREKCKVGYGYFADNSYDGIVPTDPWSIVYFSGLSSSEIAAYKARSYIIPMEPVNTTWPDQAEHNVLANAGASFPARDIIDTRIVNDVINKTGHSIATTDEQPEGGWPTLNSLPAPTDTDHDGMPDTWETTYGLNLNDANDRNGYDIHADYTNLEVYLNSLLGFDATPPSSLPQVAWTQRYNDTANNSDYAKDIAVDSTGNVIVTGYAKNTGTSYDFVTIKYTPDGNTVWTKTYNRSSSSPDYAMAIAVDANSNDANSNVIVAGYGYTAATGYDGIIVKYSPDGNSRWTAAYNYSAGSDDRFYDVATDANGNIYAVGRSNDDALLVKYTPDGSLAWIRTYNGSKYYDSYYNSFYQLVVDAGGDVYACGESAELYTGQDCLTAKYSPDGTLLWVQTYNGPVDGWDLLEAIALDSAGNVCVAGSIETETGSNYVTIKYSPDGNSLWTAFYGGVESGWDEAYAITVDSGGNIVVTGCSEGTATPSDIATVKYNSATGSELWAKRYNGAGNFTDFAEAIAADSSGNVYVHGRSVEVNSTDYVTICYQSDGTERWKMNYDGPAMLTDIGNAMALDGNSVYVTGYSMNSAGNYDYATVKYIAAPPPVNPCPAPPAGDLNDDCQVDFFDFALMAGIYDGSTEDWLILKDIADTWLECGLPNPADCWQ